MSEAAHRMSPSAAPLQRARPRCAWCEGADAEFGWWPAVLRRLLPEAPVAVRLAAACRGTGDRPVLGRVAEALAAAPAAAPVVDVGAGAGGPGEWLRRTTRRPVLAVDASAPSWC